MAKTIRRTPKRAPVRNLARTKSKRRPRKRKPGSSPFMASLRSLLLWSLLVVACILVVLFFYNQATSGKNRPDKAALESAIESALRKNPYDRKEEMASAGVNAEAVYTEDPIGLEIPTLQNGQQEQIIEHEGYTVSYNSDFKIANWVAYELTEEEVLLNKTERANKFVPDPQVEGATALNEDYSKTGYDRGHLAPAGDMKWSAKAMRESFYFSNICPQNPNLNQGIWRELEELSRVWAKEKGAIYIVTGPVIQDDLKRLGKNRVGIPKQFYKVFCTTRSGKTTGIAFLFDNRGYRDTNLQQLAVSIDSVEKVTGIDFFPLLPDEVEKEVESKIILADWF